MFRLVTVQSRWFRAVHSLASAAEESVEDTTTLSDRSVGGGKANSGDFIPISGVFIRVWKNASDDSRHGADRPQGMHPLFKL